MQDLVLGKLSAARAQRCSLTAEVHGSACLQHVEWSLNDFAFAKSTAEGQTQCLFSAVASS